jgi:hypothetical protein
VATPNPPRRVPAGAQACNLLAITLATNFVCAEAWVLHSTSGDLPDRVLPSLLFAVFWSLWGFVMTPFTIGLVIVQGPAVVSHDILPRDLVPKEALVILVSFLLGSLAVRDSAVARWLSYLCVAALTVAANMNLFGWIRQGL